MAFYLRRGFADDASLAIFNDLKLSVGGDGFQIDHLVLHRSGAIIIESKSVTTRVRVNALAEWERYFNGSWNGMPSPIAQANAQAMQFRRLLNAHKADLLGKLAGLLQKGFGCFRIDVLVAISDSGAIDRADPAIATEATKADFICDRVRSLVAAQQNSARLIKGENVAITESEFSTVQQFLLRSASWKRVKAPAPPPVPMRASGLSCSKCSDGDGSIQHGRFGYYWKCNPCGGNTKISLPGPGRLRKNGRIFTFVADDGRETAFHTNAG
jgi:hypothetical protein